MTGYLNYFQFQTLMVPALSSVAARWFTKPEKTTVAAVYTCGLQVSGQIFLSIFFRKNLFSWVNLDYNFLGNEQS